MNILNSHIFNVCMLVSFLPVSVNAKTIFEEFDEEMNNLHTQVIKNMNRMTAQMEQCFNHMSQMHAQSLSSSSISMQQTGISINEIADGIEIEAMPVHATKDNFEATISFDENSINVPTASGTLTIQINHPYLSASFYHKMNKESQQKDHSYQSAYSTQMVQTIAKEIDLNRICVKCTEHEAKGHSEQKLILKLPFKEKTITKIPITIEKHIK